MLRIKIGTIFMLICCLPFLIGWNYPDLIINSMHEIGFKLVKKQIIKIPYTDKTQIRYIFSHRRHRAVVIDEYQNGFIEIRSLYRSDQREKNKWKLTVLRAVKRENFRDTVYRIFVLGDDR